MKKLIALSLVSLFVFGCVGFSCPTQATNYKREIRKNEKKISQLKASTTLSNHYKKRAIRRLEKQNYYLKKMR